METELSLDALIDAGYDVADKYEWGARDNQLVPDEDDE